MSDQTADVGGPLDRPDLDDPTGPSAAGGEEPVDTITEIAVGGQSSEISVSADCITLINVFTVEPENQARLLELLTRATDDVVSRQPGFISANLHASLDGTRVTNYAQWASVEDLEAMLADPECQPHLARTTELGQPDARVYRVSSVHHI